MKRLKLALSIIGLFTVFYFAPSIAAQELKVRTLSLQKVVTESKVGQQARTVLELKKSELQSKFKQEQEELQAQVKDIEKKNSVWSEEVKADKEREYQKKMREYQLKVEDAQYEMKQLEKNVLDPIFKELQAVIDELGKQEKLSIIFEKAKNGGLLYSDDSLDISGLVIKKIDAKMAQ